MYKTFKESLYIFNISNELHYEHWFVHICQFMFTWNLLFIMTIASFYTYIPFDYMQKAVEVKVKTFILFIELCDCTSHIDDSGCLKAQTQYPFPC